MWTGTKTAKGFENGAVWVSVRFDNSGENFVEVFRAKVVASGWPDSEIRLREDQLNSIDISAIKLGVRDDAPPPVIIIPPTVIPPTQDELDKKAFIVLVQNWKIVKAALASGASKTVTQTDVDAAYAAWKSAYKDSYAELLVGTI